MGFWPRSLLARDYEVPKRPIFHLEGWDVVQGTDAATYVSGVVPDGVMYGTNGCLGVRHHCESETVGYRTSLYMNGVYHSAPLNAYVDSEALPEEIQVGATVCEVTLDCFIDGESGTLGEAPSQRLNLRDATYSSTSVDVVSGDGGLTFDSTYRQVVSLNELDLWCAETVCTNFSIDALSSGTDFASQNNSESSAKHIEEDMYSTESSTYSVVFIVSVTVSLDDWYLVGGDSTEKLLIESTTSGILVGTETEASCTVECGDRTYKIVPEQQVRNAPEDFYTPHRDCGFSHAAYVSESESEHPHSSRAAWRGTSGSRGRVCFQKQFPYTITPDNVPQKVTLSFHARHHNGGLPLSRPFPSFADVVAEQRLVLDNFWSTFWIDIQRQDELPPNRMKLGLIFNSFRLFCVSRNLQNGLPQAGCSTTKSNLLYDLQQYVYHGIYYILTSPSSALALLRSLYCMLSQARMNALRLSLEHGAVYPRRTITGTECWHCSTLNNARFHVNAEVGYIINMYFSAVESIDTNDRLWLLELMLETARVWSQVGEWVENEGVFRLDNIAGPDEYNGNAAGNFYVHLSAKLHLRNAYNLYEEQQKIVGDEAIFCLLQGINMDISELENFRTISNEIVVRRDNHLDVFLVHDHFDTLKEWKGERPKHPLSMNYHPLAIYRHKVVNIPEVLLGMLLYPAEFERKDLLQNLSYYAPLCTHDSAESLAIVACVEFRANGRFTHGMPLLCSLASLDLDNIIYAADEGLDFGAMSATWIAVVMGIGGVKITSRSLHLDPSFPAGLSVLSFTLHWRGATLRTRVEKDCITYDLMAGDSIRFIHANRHRIHLHSGCRQSVARKQVAIPQPMSSMHGEFAGAIFLCETLFDSVMEMNFIAWGKTLESLYENYRALHLRHIPPLTAEEFVDKVIYQAEHREIAFSGIHNVLLDRGIDLPLGSPDDAEIVETRYGLANAKVAELEEMWSREAPCVNPAMRALLRDLEDNGIPLALVSYSRTLKTLMQYHPEEALRFLTAIDGDEAHERHIKSRPHLDIFVRAAEKIHVEPSRCLIFSSHIDSNFKVSELSYFRMVFDVEDPFAARVRGSKTCEYPSMLRPAAADGDVRPLVINLKRDKFPTTVDGLESILCGPVASGSDLAAAGDAPPSDPCS
ncbi:hypothetical protein, conserved [Trypanosoma brucei gambiense DAL972]|uniref:Glycosyl hydrolase n=1 Tax=Trypanosoma brucei gambiense (strain MHOM/CI/86/DAL972) TaxID=679716 RepID=C9ZMN2_TRYB9|nr:hypothetical protein, conserved [Trypanosoma brucei gambiense DAL972]CBH10535.1 hypothetical protein, conserved [Trypanosoma brucei gambiense DAL972]|eukprot:XP_011772824.1 hypothetical protein, conserved [Trypanosoma brucei gambiense DAL972]